MKIRFIPKRKLKAATAVRRMPRAAMEDSAREPNISFGRAITVVVVLHLVAVAGVCGFLSLKSPQQNGALRSPKDAAAPAASGPAAGATAKGAGQSGAEDAGAHGAVSAAAVATPVKQPAAGNSSAGPAKSPVTETAPGVKDSGAVYTVARGDTPVSIAKKLHVGYDDLLKLNKITDPKKLKIGQKLRIPVKKKTTSTTRTPLNDEGQMSHDEKSPNVRMANGLSAPVPLIRHPPSHVS